MVRKCPRCQRGNPEDAQFCHFDGALLPAEAAPLPAETAPLPAEAAPPTVETFTAPVTTEPAAAPPPDIAFRAHSGLGARPIAAAALVFIATGLAGMFLLRDRSEPHAAAAPTPAGSASTPKGPTMPAAEGDVNDAIDRGIAYLKKQFVTFEPSPRNPGPPPPLFNDPWSNVDSGKRAMMAYTLLECGEPIGDLNIHRTARHVRDVSKHPMPAWSLAWTIIFLDRLGEPMDRTAIRSLSLRLAAAQFKKGNWTSICPPLKAEEEKIFEDYLTLASRGEKLSAQEKAKLREVQIQWDRCRESNRHLPRTVTGAIMENGDNSNTFYATIGLRAARRQDLPLGSVVAKLHQHLRATQHVDGSWWWVESYPHERATMTAAGLLGLAVSQPDAFPGQPDAQAGLLSPANDPAVAKGVRFLDHIVAVAASKKHFNRIIGIEAYDNLEFVWALSQVADVYGIDKFAGQDWYAWVSRRLVASQRFDGAWADSNPGPVDTCYALLILRRANVRSGPSRQPDHFVNRRQPDRRSR